ncbi:MAG: hypothetical protein V2J89_13730 [Halieaceae bacterium]|nr:hypothetical protein [Halieaceae bacterium]
MSSSFLEIVELPNGDIVLQRAEEEGEALVTIQFSDESKDYLLDNALEVARAMIQAGIQTAAQMAEEGHIEVTGQIDSEGEVAEEAIEEEIAANRPRVLH